MGYKEMITLLQPLGLYRLEQGDKVRAELGAYDAGLSLLMAQLQTLEREAFLPTAQGFGLSRREALFGGVLTELSIELRRKKLMDRLAHVRGAWSRTMVEEAMREQAPAAQLTEQFAAQTLVLDGLAQGTSPEQSRALYKILEELLPAQLCLLTNTAKPDWDTLDGRELDFDTTDYLDFPWDLLEEPGGITEQEETYAKQQ